MKTLLRLFSTAHALMALLFACAALLLIVIAARIGVDSPRQRLGPRCGARNYRSGGLAGRRRCRAPNLANDY